MVEEDDSTPLPAPTGSFTCDAENQKVCTEDASTVACPFFAQEFDDQDTCMCVSKRYCRSSRLRCEEGYVRDPMQYCDCMPAEEVEALTSCLETLKIKEDDSTLTIESKKCDNVTKDKDDGWSSWKDGDSLVLSFTAIEDGEYTFCDYYFDATYDDEKDIHIAISYLSVFDCDDYSNLEMISESWSCM